MKTENSRDCMSMELSPRCQKVKVLKRPVKIWSINLPLVIISQAIHVLLET